VNAGDGRVPVKWRPRLGLIVFLTLTLVLCLPLLGLFFFRIYENQLVRETEAELMAQSATLAAVFRREIEAGALSDDALGAIAPAAAGSGVGEPDREIASPLDLVEQVSPPSRPAAKPADAAFLAIGARMTPDLLETQRATFADFRLLDPHGVVIAGREDLGLSYAEIPEVAEALQGRFRGAMRLRADKRAPPISAISGGSASQIFIAIPVTVHDRVAGVVYASRAPAEMFKHLYDERRELAIAGLSVAAATLIIGFVFHRTITQPVHELIARTSAIASGDPSAMRPLKRHGTAEFAALSQSFLDMATGLKNRSDFIASFAAHVSHELKSPLTSIQGAAELLRDDVAAGPPRMSDEARRKFLDNIVADSGRLTAIVNRLREMARADTRPTDGMTSLALLIGDLRAAFPALDVEASGDLDCPVRMSAENARIVLFHLAGNAAQHGARLFEIEARVVSGNLEAILRDDGRGITPNNRAKIFESFFTTRREEGGTGMGLSIVRAMLLAHGGAIDLLEAEEGAVFRVTIPRAAEDAEAIS
jgi:signal transduction histidine kinase